MARGLACGQTATNAQRGFDVRQGLRETTCAVTFVFITFFSAALHTALVRFSDDKGIMVTLVHLEQKKANWMENRADGPLSDGGVEHVA